MDGRPSKQAAFLILIPIQQQSTYIHGGLAPMQHNNSSAALHMTDRVAVFCFGRGKREMGQMQLIYNPAKESLMQKTAQVTLEFHTERRDFDCVPGGGGGKSSYGVELISCACFLSSSWLEYRLCVLINTVWQQQ